MKSLVSGFDPFEGEKINPSIKEDIQAVTGKEC